MKKYIIDQSLFLVLGIAIMILVPFFGGPFFTLIFEIAIIISWGYLCRRILFLPLDLVLGKVTKTVYFSTQCGNEKLEFFKNKYCCEWKFYSGSGQTLRLLVPIAIAKKETYNMVSPLKDVKLKVTYYRLSKILLEWNQE